MRRLLNIAIIGSRGIPNNYGGFEQLAQHLAAGLLQNGHRVTVYNSHNHPFKAGDWNGVKIVHCFDAEKMLGITGQFIYDLNCIRHARKSNYDVLLFLGYTSSSVWGKFFPKEPVIISNMDGMEWKREKYSRPVQKFLKYAEKLAVKFSDFHIADSPVIQKYVNNTYDINSTYIPYGADLSIIGNEELLEQLQLEKWGYHMLMARMEPENNIDMILAGFTRSHSAKQFVVVGKFDNAYGRLMYKKFSADRRIRFAGALFEAGTTNTLRNFCRLYFHGHSVGGTNPSLLQAMACGSVIAAHDNEFNRAVLKEDAFYFSSACDVTQLVEKINGRDEMACMVENNFVKIETEYNWPCIVERYEQVIIDCYNSSRS